MEVILREHVDNLGRRGDVVKVAAGYARNYLLPRKLALPATAGNRKHVERERKIMDTREAEERSQAEAIAARIATVDITLTRRVGDTEQLYGSVTSADIAQALQAKGFEFVTVPQLVEAARPRVLGGVEGAVPGAPAGGVAPAGGADADLPGPGGPADVGHSS